MANTPALAGLVAKCVRHLETRLGPCPVKIPYITWDEADENFGRATDAAISISCRLAVRSHYLAHELAHLWINPKTRPLWTLWWQIEAVAEYLALDFLWAVQDIPTLKIIVTENIGRYVLVTEILGIQLGLNSPAPPSDHSVESDAVSFLLGALACALIAEDEPKPFLAEFRATSDYAESVRLNAKTKRLQEVTTSRQLAAYSAQCSKCAGLTGFLFRTCASVSLGHRSALAQMARMTSA